MSLAIDPFNRFENKDQPKPVARTKIVEAYGLRKCPKLVEQICSNTLEVRNNALNVLCNEFENPYSVEQTGRVGVVGILAGMVSDSDFTTRVRATLALALAARDANGVKAILEATAVPSILTAIQDKSEVVRGNVYGCLLHICRLNTGVAACVAAGTVQMLVQVLRNELDEMKPTILQTLYKLVGNEQGLLAAINANAVEHFIKLLQQSTSETEPLDVEHESRIILECSKALGFLCYDGRAKQGEDRKKYHNSDAALDAAVLLLFSRPQITAELMLLSVLLLMLLLLMLLLLRPH
jgi:hypothetical protein